MRNNDSVTTAVGKGCNERATDGAEGRDTASEGKLRKVGCRGAHADDSSPDAVNGASTKEADVMEEKGNTAPREGVIV